VVTNAVAIDQDIMFISNGEAGVMSRRAARRSRRVAPELRTITMRGKLRFGNLQSVNTSPTLPAGPAILAS